MKAMLCRAYGPPSQLELAEVPDLVPGKDEVVIRVKAAALNFPDTLVIQGKYQFQPPMPFSPGTDVAGIITAVGDSVEGLAVGTPVFAFLPSMGGFAEEARADAAMIAPIPSGIDFATAAAFQMTYTTAYHALKDRAMLQSGETVLVLGAAGGVGMAAIELAKHMGARVIAAASSDEKLAACTKAGADATINYRTEDLRAQLKTLTAGNGVDVVYDPVGGVYAEPALRSMAWNGRYLVIGFTAGEIPRIPLNLPLLKGCSIIGVFLGGFFMHEPARNAANMRELTAMLADGSLHPLVSRTYPLVDAAVALEDMMERRVTGKVVLVTE
jgi:NADPH:quinone reductase